MTDFRFVKVIYHIQLYAKNNPLYGQNELKHTLNPSAQVT